MFKKLALGDYEWMTYNMVHASALSFGAGLRFHLGQKPKSLITIYSETRAEWMMSCLGAFSQVRCYDSSGCIVISFYLFIVWSIDENKYIKCKMF